MEKGGEEEREREGEGRRGGEGEGWREKMELGGEREEVLTFNMPFSGFFGAFGASVSSRDSEENQSNLNHKINQQISQPYSIKITIMVNQSKTVNQLWNVWNVWNVSPNPVLRR